MRYYKKEKVDDPKTVLRDYYHEAFISDSDLDPFSVRSTAAKFLNKYLKYENESLSSIQKELKNKSDEPHKYAPLLVILRRREKSLPSNYTNASDSELNRYMKKLKTTGTQDRVDRVVSNLGIPIGAVVGTVGLGHLMDKAVVTTDEKPIKKLYESVKSTGQINPKTTLEFISDPLGSYYHPGKDAVVTGKDLSVAAHEFGHAENQAKTLKILGEKPGKLFSTLKYMEAHQIPYIGPTLQAISPAFSRIPVLGLASLPLITKPVTNLIKGDSKKGVRHAVGTTMYEHPEAVVIPAVAPKLWEEASASVKGIKNIIKYIEPGGSKLQTILKHTKKLGPAFGTYLLASGIPVGAAIFLGRNRRRQRQLHDTIKL